VRVLKGIGSSERSNSLIRPTTPQRSGQQLCRSVEIESMNHSGSSSQKTRKCLAGQGSVTVFVLLEIGLEIQNLVFLASSESLCCAEQSGIAAMVFKLKMRNAFFAQKQFL